MIAICGKIRIQLAVAGACVALLFGLLVPTVKLLAPEPVTCGMACCLDSGECCCMTRWTEEDERDHEEPTIASRSELIRGCPPNCAITPSASPTFVPKSDRNFALYLIPRFLNERSHELRILLAARQRRASSSPRAPPCLFL